MGKVYIYILIFLVASCSSRPEHALLHPPPSKSAKENLPLHISYLKSIVSEENNTEVLKKALQLLQQNQWPEGYESDLQALSKNMEVSDSASLVGLISYYQEVDNQYMLRLYTGKAQVLGFTSSETLSAISQNFYNDNKLDSAKKYILSALKKENGFSHWLLKARIELAQSDTISAITSFKTAESMALLKTKDLIPFLKLLYSNQSLADALVLGEKYLVMDSTSSDLILCMAAIKQSLNQPNEAINLLQKLPSGSMERFKAMIAIYNKLGFHEKILQETNSLLQYEHLENAVLLARARAFDKKWQLNKAIDMYEQLLEKDTATQVVRQELEKVKGKAAYLRRMKELDTNINNQAQ